MAWNEDYKEVRDKLEELEEIIERVFYKQAFYGEEFWRMLIYIQNLWDCNLGIAEARMNEE